MDIGIPVRMGMAALTRLAFHGNDLSRITKTLMRQSKKQTASAAALMDLSVIEQLNGNLSAGLDYQLKAFADSRLFQTRRNTPGKKRVLVLAAPIHMGGNTPVEFLLERSDYEIMTYYVIPGMPSENRIPDHDIAFVAAPGDSGLTRQFVDEIERRVADWPTNVLNSPSAIKRLERDSLHGLVDSIEQLRCPAIVRCNRADLRSLMSGMLAPSDLITGLDFPIVVRPVGSHAGRGLAKIRQPSDFAHYLRGLKDTEFFISEYVDYSSSKDGAFRKYRIIFVDGVPFPCHMAIADQWKVWYMNAGMQENPEKRAEEKRFMDNFNRNFAIRHQAAFDKLTEAIGLDYFGIDCAEDGKGNLLLFEADNALIVHDMDCETVFPYKKYHMHKLFDAFESMLDARSVGTFEDNYSVDAGVANQALQTQRTTMQ